MTTHYFFLLEELVSALGNMNSTQVFTLMFSSVILLI